MSRSSFLATVAAAALCSFAAHAETIIIADPAVMPAQTAVVFYPAPAAVVPSTASPVSLVVPAAPSPTDRDLRDPRVAAGHFIERLSDAELALTIGNPALADTHIAVAEQLAGSIRANHPDNAPIAIALGRRAYVAAGTVPVTYRYEYLPTASGYVEVTTTQTMTPHNGLGFSDAEAVDVILDFSSGAAAEHLQAARAAIAVRNDESARQHLAAAASSVMHADDDASAVKKARNNIALARYFALQQSYGAAHHALRHANEALQWLQTDIQYREQHDSIVAMRLEVDNIQRQIEHNDRPALQNADIRMQRWGRQLDHWQRA